MTTILHPRLAKSFDMLAVYVKLFEPFRHKPIKLVEVGIDHGGSLDFWARTYPVWKVLGIDLPWNEQAGWEKKKESVDEIVGWYKGRVQVEFANQTHDEAMLDVMRSFSPVVDVIIDDASHDGKKTAAMFANLFYNTLDDGGLYIVEDWLSADDREGMERFVHDLVRAVGDWDSGVASVDVYSKMVVVTKGIPQRSHT